jgi:O-antigen/teichoic acid export membrane protein
LKEYRIVKNVLFNLLRGGVLLPVELILIPFVLHRIGVSGFGIWALLRIFIVYGNIFDLGFSVAIEKHTAEHIGARDYASLNRLLNVSFLFYLAISLLIFFAVMVLKNWMIKSFFSEGTKAFEALPFILLFSAGIFGMNLLLGLSTSLLNGIQRFDLTNTISMISALLNLAGILLVLSLGYGLEGLIVVQGLVVLITGLGSLWMVYRRLPEIRLKPFGPFLEAGDFLKILSYGLSVQTTRLAMLIHLHLDKFFLGYFLGLQYVTYYEIASRLVERLRAVPQMLIQPIMVAISELEAQGEMVEINRIYTESLRYMVLFSLPIFVFIALFINPIMKLWLGDAYPLTIKAFLVLATAHFINMLTGPGFLTFLGIGLPRYGALCSIMGSLLHILLGILLITLFGYDGTLLASFSAVVLPSIGFILIFYRTRKISLREDFHQLLVKPMIFSLCPAILTSMTAQKLIGGGLNSLVIAFLTFLAFYGPGAWIVLGKAEQLRIKAFCVSFWNRTY